MALLDPKTNTLYDMDLGDELPITQETQALRVPGGWVFISYIDDENGGITGCSCFVPFNTEFQYDQHGS